MHRHLVLLVVAIALLSCGTAGTDSADTSPATRPASDIEAAGEAPHRDSEGPSTTTRSAPAQAHPAEPSVEPADEPGRDADAQAACRPDQVDVNDADQPELERIVHIGSARAEQVHELRPFVNLRDLSRIPGIAERRLTDIVKQDLACIG